MANSDSDYFRKKDLEGEPPVPQALTEGPNGPHVCNKYQILDRSRRRSDWVFNAYVLKPESDLDAREALRFYADRITEDNPDFARQIIIWLTNLDNQYPDGKKS